MTEARTDFCLCMTEAAWKYPFHVEKRNKGCLQLFSFVKEKIKHKADKTRLTRHVFSQRFEKRNRLMKAFVLVSGKKFEGIVKRNSYKMRQRSMLNEGTYRYEHTRLHRRWQQKKQVVILSQNNPLEVQARVHHGHCPSKCCGRLQAHVRQQANQQKCTYI